MGADSAKLYRLLQCVLIIWSPSCASINITYCASDIDECADPLLLVCSGADGCDNTEGSYECLCTTGFEWNGTLCTGKH